MAKPITVAVMHCSKREHQKVVDLGYSVLNSMYDHPAEFSDPPVTLAGLASKAFAAALAQSKVSEGGMKELKMPDDAIDDLFDVLKYQFMVYTNSFYRGNAEKLLLSGFEVSRDRIPHPFAEPPVIGHITAGPVPHSAMIVLMRNLIVHIRRESIKTIRGLDGRKRQPRNVIQTGPFSKGLPQYRHQGTQTGTGGFCKSICQHPRRQERFRQSGNIHGHMTRTKDRSPISFRHPHSRPPFTNTSAAPVGVRCPS